MGSPIRPEPAGALPSRAVLLAAAYVLFVCACFVVEAAGRRACHVPSHAWIDAGADARERALRGFRRTKADECLDATGWYSYGTALLYGIAVVSPLVIVVLSAKRLLRLVQRLDFFQAEMGAVLFAFFWLAGMAVFMVPYFYAHTLFDAYGLGGP